MDGKTRHSMLEYEKIYILMCRYIYIDKKNKKIYIHLYRYIYIIRTQVYSYSMVYSYL